VKVEGYLKEAPKWLKTARLAGTEIQNTVR
jgi:hypothetical protein